MHIASTRARRRVHVERGLPCLGGPYFPARRYAPLKGITPENVDQLEPVWSFSTGGNLDGLEATPLLSDGVLYLSADHARVFAVDARTGVMQWQYVPEYDEDLASKLCCGPVNRGVAL